MKRSVTPCEGAPPARAEKGQRPPTTACPFRQKKQLAMPARQVLTLPTVLGK